MLLQVQQRHGAPNIQNTSTAWEKLDVHQLFINFKQAYDTITPNTGEHLDRHGKYGNTRKLNQANETMCKQHRIMCKNRKSNSDSSQFTVKSGLQQGLSPLLFITVLDVVLKKANINIILTNQGPQMILAFADDIDTKKIWKLLMNSFEPVK